MLAQMRPYLKDSPLEWRGDSGIVIFRIGNPPGQCEVMGSRPEFNERRFHSLMRFRGQSAFRRCRCGGIGDGWFLPSPTGRDHETDKGESCSHSRERAAARSVHTLSLLSK